MRAGAAPALSDREVGELSAASAMDLSMFRRTHVEARVSRALGVEELGSIDELRDRLVISDAARGAFRRSMAISVTGLFRDPEQFDLLAEHLDASRATTRSIRAWSAGCATGHEAWSIAATLGRLQDVSGAMVLGSDLLPENVRVARALTRDDLGLDASALPPALRMRFEIRDLVNQGVSGGGWDLVLCRNVAIYFEPDRRATLHRRLAGCLRSGGLLMLGRSERLHAPASVGLERVAPHLYRRTA